MKSTAISFGILVLIAIAYFTNIFDLFVGRKAFWTSIGLVTLVFLVAFKVLGNPFKEFKK